MSNAVNLLPDALHVTVTHVDHPDDLPVLLDETDDLADGTAAGRRRVTVFEAEQGSFGGNNLAGTLR